MRSCRGLHARTELVRAEFGVHRVGAGRASCDGLGCFVRCSDMRPLLCRVQTVDAKERSVKAVRGRVRARSACLWSPIEGALRAPGVRACACGFWPSATIGYVQSPGVEGSGLRFRASNTIVNEWFG